MDLEHELDLDDLGQVFVPEEPISAEDLLERVTVLDAQVQFCVDYMNDCGILDDGCFTFPDGETVHASKTLSIPVKIDDRVPEGEIWIEGHGKIYLSDEEER